MSMSTPAPLQDPAVLDRVRKICRNCHLGKYRHFNAATRAKRLNDYLGVPVVAINIVLGSVFFVALSQDLPAIAKWGGGFLALAAALISGIATFFNFGKQFEGHRALANKYVNLAAKCETAIARFRDGLTDLGGLDGLLQEFQQRYSEINEEAKVFPTSDRDFKIALESESVRVEPDLRSRSMPPRSPAHMARRASGRKGRIGVVSRAYCRLSYTAINLDGADVEIRERPRQGLGRNEVAIGDLVGFVGRDHKERSGRIVRLNDKTVTLDCEQQHWRVSYGLLHRVVESEASVMGGVEILGPVSGKAGSGRR